MLELIAGSQKRRGLRLLCLGAHSDDLEIGCGATLLTSLSAGNRVHVDWVVFSAAGERAVEARRSASALLRTARSSSINLFDFRDGYLGASHAEVKDVFEQLKRRLRPDLIFSHRLEDRHQDHRLVGELTWNTFRDHLILEYEIPKYEGDLGHPNAYVPVTPRAMKRKVSHLERYFASQRSKDWFAAATFLGLGRLRGLECRAPGGYAEAFHGRKLRLAAPG
jgi:LmbE family N-acetylglucosaminyl deacetylase